MSDQPLNIRDAVVADAEAVCEVLRRSITELCAADHHHDLAIIIQWLANKTPPTVATWIGQPNNSFLVAVGANGRILGAASVTDKGEITLNYVSPDARFQGVSRALLHALETRAAARGSSRCALHSTVRPASTRPTQTCLIVPKQKFVQRFFGCSLPRGAL